MSKDITKIKVLVADDSMFMRKYIINMLHELGIEDTVEASNGGEAIDVYFDQEPDIVLLDIIMPVKTGLEALKQIVGRGGKVIMVSAMGQKSVVDEAMNIGAVGFIIKPFFTAEDLSEKIKKFIAEE